MHEFRFITLDKIEPVTIAGKKMSQLLVAQTAQDRRIRDFVAVQMENGKDCSILCRIEKLVGMPAGRERTRFALSIANHAASDQSGIIKDCTICMDQRIAQFSAFVNRAGSLGGGM